MATSALSPIVSDDQKSIWLICDSKRNINQFNVYEFTLPTTLDANQNILVGATEAGTQIAILNTSDPMQSSTINIANDGDVRALVATYSSNKIVTTTAPYVVASILLLPPRTQNGYVERLRVFASSTNTAELEAGDYYALVISGGGGGGGSAVRPANYPATGSRAAVPGGGGASGGFSTQAITLNATVNAITVGSGGGGGNNVSDSTSTITAPSGGSGGTTNFSNITVTGGGGGAGGLLVGNTGTTGAGGTAAPGGTAGGPGHISGIETSYNNAYYAGLTSASGSGGRNRNIISEIASDAVVGNIGSGGSDHAPAPPAPAPNSQPTAITVFATGYGGGGGGGGGRINSPANASAESVNASPGTPGAVYVIRVG